MIVFHHYVEYEHIFLADFFDWLTDWLTDQPSFWCTTFSLTVSQQSGIAVMIN
jgi:hypothetical protein